MKLTSLIIAALALSASAICHANAFDTSQLLADSNFIAQSERLNLALASYAPTEVAVASNNLSSYWTFGKDQNAKLLEIVTTSGQLSRGSYLADIGGKKDPRKNPTATGDTKNVPDGGLTLALVGLGMACLAACSGWSRRIVLA